MRAAMDTLFVRLTALESMVTQKPIITGRYSESPYINFMKPIEARKRHVFCRFSRLNEEAFLANCIGALEMANNINPLGCGGEVADKRRCAAATS